MLFLLSFINNAHFWLRFYFVDNPVFVVYTKLNYKKEDIVSLFTMFVITRGGMSSKIIKNNNLCLGVFFVTTSLLFSISLEVNQRAN